MKKYLFLLLIFGSGILWNYYHHYVYDGNKVNQAMQRIQEDFNNENWKAIYDSFTDDIKNSQTQDEFFRNMTIFKSSTGNLTATKYYYPDLGGNSIKNLKCHMTLNSFETEISVGLFNLCLDNDGQLTQFIFDFQSSPSLYEFMKRSQKNSTTLFALRDGVPVIDWNGNAEVPILQTIQTIITIQFSWQVTQGRINKNEWVPIDNQLNLFYLPNVDIGHTQWLKHMKFSGKIKNNQIKIKNIVKGMVDFGSLCNSEYLQGRLGLDNIISLMVSLGIKSGNKVIYLVSSLLALQKPDNISSNDYPNYLLGLNHNDIVQKSEQIHNILAVNTNPSLRENDEWLLSADVLDTYTRVSLLGTSKEYVYVMRKINSNKYFDKKTQKLILKFLDRMEMNTNFGKINFSQAGYIIGQNNYPMMNNSVMSILGYSTLKNGTHIEYGLYFDSLQSEEWQDIYEQAISFISFLQIDKQFLDIIGTHLV